MKPITIWRRKNRDGMFEHNHISDGHDVSGTPQPICAEQAAAWHGAVWQSEPARLVDGVVQRIAGSSAPNKLGANEDNA